MAGQTRDFTCTAERRGFSLVEMVVVVVVIAVTAAIGVPRYTSALLRYRADMAARRIVTDLAAARTRARITGASQTVIFVTGTNSYSIPGMPGLDNPAASYGVWLADKPYQASLVSVSFGGSATLTFNGYGTPASGGQVVVQAGSARKTVLLDAGTGEATIQ
jgi:prepilin-type N-terminal cleavage/methylation domain-containing protein